MFDLSVSCNQVIPAQAGIQETWLTLWILVITAQPDHKLHALKVRAKDFISKPFELAEVLARVHNMLEVRLLHKELHNYNEILDKRVKESTAGLQASRTATAAPCRSIFPRLYLRPLCRIINPLAISSRRSRDRLKIPTGK